MMNNTTSLTPTTKRYYLHDDFIDTADPADTVWRWLVVNQYEDDTCDGVVFSEQYADTIPDDVIAMFQVMVDALNAVTWQPVKNVEVQCVCTEPDCVGVLRVGLDMIEIENNDGIQSIVLPDDWAVCRREEIGGRHETT